MALHERPGKSDEWYTPKAVFDALGCKFDLDVASPGKSVVPWVPARRHLTAGSLTTPWNGMVWMNAPFGGRNGLIPWLTKFFEHGYGIALTPDRTSAPWWQRFAPRADLCLFVSPKIKFVDRHSRPGPSPANGTSLFACGEPARVALRRAALNGLGILWQPIR